jgi:hypothetical protein
VKAKERSGKDGRNIKVRRGKYTSENGEKIRAKKVHT